MSLTIKHFLCIFKVNFKAAVRHTLFLDWYCKHTLLSFHKQFHIWWIQMNSKH